ncbi:hypothetical protein BWZ22_13855 [Seonamhaeicola sp. S2-3]|uniref:hypothetical protein n=1 Tax=Seonamhaeicola sp. S2-3 TaxID=1936081 RepID=UPI0009726D45|nr:hypothetical protein [Seonamhaeicola sp. S2-3]APY12242.1 hypothetical protein BWZ22_13855 [Seonamhaeicola sp. S2-3]
MKPKKILKIILGTVIFLTLPSLLFFGFLYFKYNEGLPQGTEGKQADAVATKMLIALNYEAFVSTEVFEWTYKKRHHYKWEKSKNTCDVYWKQYKVNLDLKDKNNHQAFVHSFQVDGDLAEELIEKAIKYYENDSFWVFAPFRIFNQNVKRALVGNDLLVTYSNGNSYLWQLDDNGKPHSFKMWTSELPIKGLEASWTDWTHTETGVYLPTFHKILFFGMEISDIKVTD